MKTQTIYLYYVKAGGSGCWVCAVDDADAVEKACAKLGLNLKTSAAHMQAYRIGKVGVQAAKASKKTWQ